MSEKDVFFEETKRSIDYRMKTFTLEEQVKYLANLNKYVFNLWLNAYIDEYKKRTEVEKIFNK